MTPERLATARRISAEVEAAGLTPLDLCSWAFLLVLSGRANDLDWKDSVQREIEGALHRKAEDLDAEKHSDFHRTIAGERRHG